nr:S-layer homology domain-containing protein [uncultured Agathobaculum sp.]
MKKRVLSVLLCLAMAVGMLPTMAFAGESDTKTEFPYTYATENAETAEKVSHPKVAPNSKVDGSRRNDGIVDYIDNGQIAANGGYGDDSGCRGQSYSWSAMAYGDWIYTGLNYNALGQTVQLMDVGLGHKYDPELLPGILNVLYNGDFFTAERDNSAKVPGGALVKINTNTGEVKILMSKTAGKYTVNDNVNFRNAVEYNGKFYFCGSVDHAPQIWQVDPKTDDCKMVYGMTAADFGEGFKKGISAGIRGMCVYKDELIVSCVTKNDEGEFEAQIYSTKTPDDPESFTVIATQGDLFNYPAFHFSDSIYGGSIWEIVEFNNKLYVSICTGTPENKPDENTMQSFAIVCGEKNDSTGKWTWTPVVGDKDDGAEYTFGIDPERTCSGAGVLMVYKDHLYIGEYNDEEIALMQVMFNLDFGFMNENLKQSVNLYRMDKNEKIDLVVGDPTKMFPNGGSSDIGSGFGHNENQYIWRMTVHNDKLYCGTFDTSSLLEPVGQFSNGDLASWEPVQWNRLFNYIRELLKLTWDKYGTLPIAETGSEAQTREDIRELFAFFDSTSLAAISDDDTVLPGAGIDAEYDLLAQIFSDLPEECFNDEGTLDKDLSAIFNEDVAAYDRGDDDMQVLPDSEQMKKLAQSMEKLIELTKKIIVTAQYMSVAERGCDVYVTEDGVNFETITTDGFGDPFNHGLRVFAETDNGLGFGTANPFYGTQWWLIREDNKPEKPVETTIPTSYIVRCNTHGAKTMDLIWDTVKIGEVTKYGDSYVCPITVSTEAYAKAYSTDVKHSAVQANITFNMTWDGKAWKAPAMTELPVIELTCENTKPEPEQPEKPAETVLPEKYIVCCTKEEHDSKHMDQLPKTVTIGEVTKSGDSYVCPITVSTKAYAKAYSEEVGKDHSAVKESITFNMTWNGKAWEAPVATQLPTIEVKCASSSGNSGSSGGSGSHSSSTYPIIVEETKNGEVTSSHKKASKGTTVTLTVTPDKNRALRTLTVVDSKDKEIMLTEKNGKYTFTMPASKVTVKAAFKANFTDVPNGSYFEDAVDWASANGITGGISATLFNPDGICTRAQAVTFLWRAAGSPAPKSTVMPFVDVPADSYYYDAVLWATELGITKGTSYTTFSPNEPCSRAQIVTFLWRANGSPAVGGSVTFSDVAADAYYATAVIWAEKNGITGGIGGGLFGSNNHCTRAQIVTFLYRTTK